MRAIASPELLELAAVYAARSTVKLEVSAFNFQALNRLRAHLQTKFPVQHDHSTSPGLFTLSVSPASDHGTPVSEDDFLAAVKKEVPDEFADEVTVRRYS